MANRLIYIVLLLCSVRTGFAASQCYYPNVEKATDFPCDPDAEESACCGNGLGSSCRSNKLCMGANGNIIRGSCTDKNWASSECAMFCTGRVGPYWSSWESCQHQQGARTGGTDLVSCSNVTNSDTSYCCDHEVDCCDIGVGRFNVLPSEPDVWATYDQKSTRYVVVGTMFTSETTSTSTRATTTDASTATITSAPSTTTSENSASSVPSLELSTGAKAGIGAGIGVGVTAIVAVVYLLWRMRNNKRAAEENNQLPSNYDGAPLVHNSWQESHYAPKMPLNPQELHGHQFQGHDVRAELQSHN